LPIDTRYAVMYPLNMVTEIKSPAALPNTWLRAVACKTLEDAKIVSKSGYWLKQTTGGTLFIEVKYERCV